MPNNRVYNREKQRKKARHSSDSESDREDSRRRYREKSRDRNKRRYSKERDRNSKSGSSRGRKRYSSSSSSSSSSDSSRRSRHRNSSTSSSSSSDSSDNRQKTSKKFPSKSGSSNTKCEFSSELKFFKIYSIFYFPVYDTKTKFDLHDLYGKDSDRPTALKDIDSDTFQQREFQSKNIIVDLKKDQVIVPETSKPAENEEESLIHPDFIGDEQAKVEKWLKKMYLYRKQIRD